MQLLLSVWLSILSVLLPVQEEVAPFAELVFYVGEGDELVESPHSPHSKQSAAATLPAEHRDSAVVVLTPWEALLMRAP